MKDKIFGVLQRVGRSFMLPIALLPVAGLLLGIGSSFTNETMLAAYGLNSVIHPGTLIYTILDVMSQTGSAVFNNLALLFAMGVAIGMARKEKEVAALSGAVAYIIMNTAIQAMINAAGGVEAMPANSTTTMLGITTLQMGVFGGIVVGLGVAALHNKFYKIELPQVLAFFGGTRFVPIVSSIVYLVVGIGAIVASWHWEVAARAQRRSEELARQRVAYLEEYENAQAQVRAVAHLRHDLRNEMAAARALQERGRAEEARRLLCAMAERVSTEEMPEGGSL